MNKTLIQVAQEIEQANGRLFIVGGWVRDQLMGIESNDMDLMVQGLNESEVVAIFSQFGSFEQVIGNAPVFMFSCCGQSVEVALARKEISVSQGKHGFNFVADKNVSIKNDLARRDFTINALAKDFLTGEIFDFFGGQSDIEDGILRPVSEAFIESPERVLRGMAQAARFDFLLTNEFFDFSIEMKKDFNTIPVEQIWRHFEKMLLKGQNIALALDILRWTQWVNFFPELDNLSDHNRTQFAVNKMVDICDRENIQDRTVLILAAMSHQMGEKTFDFLKSIGCPQKLQSKIKLLNDHQLVWWQDVINSKIVKNLSVDLTPCTIRELGFLVESIFGWLPQNMGVITSIADRLNIINQPLEPVLMGRHLITLGFKPGKIFGQILSESFKAQLNEEFDNLEGAISWLNKNYP